VLRKVEQALQAAIEKPFSRLFPQKLQPAEMKARLRETLESSARKADGVTVAANRYTVEVNLADVRDMAEVGPVLEQELVAYVYECAADARLTVGPYVEVDLVAGETIASGELQVRAEFAPRPPACLQVESGLPQRGQQVALGDRSTVGRSPDCDVVVGDEAVSRRHCEVMWYHVQYVVRDTQSANGTFVNGEQVQVAPLREGDLLEVGLVQLRFHDGPPHAAS
jgi:hypothetical protein